jgi:hypothetical protein
MGLGRFQAAWSRTEAGYNISFAVPDGTSGELELPCLVEEEMLAMEIDGESVEQGRGWWMGKRSEGVVAVGRSVARMNVMGGRHSVCC